MPFIFPDLIKKDAKIEELDNLTLEYWHDKLHILWARLEDGTNITDWDFFDIYDFHRRVIASMKTKGLKHIAPINSLDVVEEH